MKTNIKKLIQELFENNNQEGLIVQFIEQLELQNYIDEIYEILINSYKNIGGLKTYKNKKDFIDKAKFAKIVKYNNKIIAVAIYRRIEYSFKMVAIGCINNNLGKNALQEIIKDDIKNYKLHYWCEVSGAIEHYFKKYNGYPIINKFVYQILNISEDKIRLCEDNVHYEREIGFKDNREWYQKMIYGFKDEETYNKVIKAVEDYSSFMKKVNNINERISPIFNKHQSIFIIENIYRANEEDDFNELIPKWYDLLVKSVDTLNSIEEKDDTVYDYIEYGEYLLKNMQLLKIHEIKL